MIKKQLFLMLALITISTAAQAQEIIVKTIDIVEGKNTVHLAKYPMTITFTDGNVVSVVEHGDNFKKFEGDISKKVKDLTQKTYQAEATDTLWEAPKEFLLIKIITDNGKLSAECWLMRK